MIKYLITTISILSISIMLLYSNGGICLNIPQGMGIYVWLMIVLFFLGSFLFFLSHLLRIRNNIFTNVKVALFAASFTFYKVSVAMFWGAGLAALFNLNLAILFFPYFYLMCYFVNLDHGAIISIFINKFNL